MNSPVATPLRGYGNPLTASFNTTGYGKELAMINRVLAAEPGLAKSVFLQTRIGAGRGLVEDIWDRKNDTLRKKAEMKDEVEAFIAQYMNIFKAHVEVECENNDFYNGIQWDSPDIQNFLEANLPAHQSNRMTPWIRTFTGEQRSTETVWNPVGMDEKSHAYAGLVGHIIRSIAQANEYSDTVEAPVFFDGIVGGRGYSYVCPDPHDPFGNVQIQRIRPQEIMYDLYSAQSGSLKDTVYLLRAYYKDLEDLIAMYPEWEGELRNWGPADYGYMAHNLKFMLFEPRIPSVLKNRDFRKANFMQHGIGGRGRQRAFVMEFYRKRAKPGFSVYDSFAHIEHFFEIPGRNSIEQAISFYKDLRMAYAYAFAAEGKKPVEVVDPPRRYDLQGYDREVWAGLNLLEVTWTESDTPPYQQFCPEYRDGEWRGLFEDDKDHQRIINRMLVWMEILLGGAKGKDVINMKMFPAGTTPDDVEEWLTRPTKPLLINSSNPAAVENVMKHYDAAQQGTYHRELMEFAKNASNFINGGENQLGVPAFAGQSAKLGAELKRSAQTSHVKTYSSLEMWQRETGWMTWAHARFLSPNRKFAVVDDNNKALYASMLAPQAIGLANGVESIKGFQYKITMSEKVKSLSERDRQHQDVMAVMQQAGADNAKYIMPLALETADLDQDKITKILNAIAEDEDRAQKLAVMQEDRLNYAEAEKWNKVREELMLERMRIEALLHPPPKTSLTGKFVPGPYYMAAVNEQQGIPSDPEGMARDHASITLMNQDAADLAEENWLAGLHPEERRKFLESSTSMPAKPPTAKSRISRMNKKQEA